MSIQGLSTGLSALRAAQAGLEIASHNLANAGTPGYHRQSVVLNSRESALSVQRNTPGAGVEVDRFRQARIHSIEQSQMRNISLSSDVETQLSTLQSIEVIFEQGQGSLHEHLANFVADLRRLSPRPGDPTLRRLALEQGERFAQELRAADAELVRMQNTLDQQIELAVHEVNRLSTEISALNRSLAELTARGVEPNDVLDQRDQLVAELSRFVDPVMDHVSQVNPAVRFGGGAVLIGLASSNVEVRDVDGLVQIVREGTERPLTLAGGQLAGLLRARNELTVDFRQRLDKLAIGTMQALDSVHVTGTGQGRGFDVLTGTRAVPDVTSVLSESLPNFAMQSGRLFVTVTAGTAGTRVLSELAINPQTDTLTDIAARIDAVEHLNARVDAQTGLLTIVADTGYEFDFTGRPTTQPTGGAYTGSSAVNVAGIADGAENQTFRFVAQSGGQVGVTPGIVVDVLDESGRVFRTVDLGTDYEPGSPILVNGLTITFASGTLNAGDEFTLQAVTEPDETGVLAALGLNTLFEGAGARDIRISAQILDDPARFAVSRPGDTGDGDNLRRMLNAIPAQDVDGAIGLHEYLIETAALAGSRVQGADNVLLALDDSGERIAAERESVSGVDSDEELVNILQFQRAFQAAARLLATMDETMDELLIMLS